MNKTVDKKEMKDMPLPFVPFIVAGAVATSAAVAGKKGYDSYQNMQEIKEVSSKIESKYKKAYENLESARKKTNQAFDKYGRMKMYHLNNEEGSLKRFVTTFQSIKNINFKNDVRADQLKSVDVQETLKEIKKQVLKANQILKSGAVSIGSGGVAAMGALGATKLFAAASTGTKIATLSGVAAKNATLAFLGGGAKAVGGLGIAGGVGVLGGIALAPALAIGSVIFASSTEKNLEEVYRQKAEIEPKIEELKAATVVMNEIQRTTKSLRQLAQSTSDLLINYIEKMEEVISVQGNDYTKYSAEEKKIIFLNYQLATILKSLFDTSILEESGKLNPKVKKMIGEKQEELESFM